MRRSPSLRGTSSCCRSPLTTPTAPSLTFNLLPGQGRIRGAWHVGFTWEKVTWCEALAAAFRPAWPRAGGFRNTSRGAEGVADVPEPPADAARGERPGGVGVLLPGAAEIAGEGAGEQEL